jgi:hypothetical protein
MPLNWNFKSPRQDSFQDPYSFFTLILYKSMYVYIYMYVFI